MSNLEHTRPLPCPHCGGSEHLYPSYRFSSLTGRVEEKPHAIDCVQCGYDFTPRDGFDVIALWNTRFDPSDLTALAKAQDEAGDLRLQNELISDTIKALVEAVEQTECPRPANGSPEDTTAKDCFEAGDCGCCYGYALSQAKGDQP